MFTIRSSRGFVPGNQPYPVARKVARWMSSNNPNHVYAVIAPSGATVKTFKGGYPL